MDNSLDSFKLKIFKAYLEDTGSTFEGFIKEKKLDGASEEAINNAKLEIIEEAIEIMGKDDLFKNYLSAEDYSSFKELGF